MKIIKLIIRVIIAMLWVYVALKKIFSISEFKSVLYKSALIESYQVDFLSIILPIIEIIIFILLFIRNATYGYYLSLLMLLTYTGYLIVLNDFSIYEGCSCGGIFYSLSYQEHLIVNGIFIILNLFILFVDDKKTSTNTVYNS